MELSQGARIAGRLEREERWQTLTYSISAERRSAQSSWPMRSSRRRGKRRAALGGGEALPRRTAPGNRRDQEPQAGLRRRARSCGSRRARAAPASARSARRSGDMAVRSTDLSPARYDYAFPKKKLLGALRSALAAKIGRRQVDDCGLARAGQSRRPSSTAQRSTSSRRQAHSC